MGSDYTDQDTERARQREQQSSAGLYTQQLAAPPQPGLAPAARASGRNNLAALALIAVGVVMFLSRFAPDRGALTAGMILLTIASCLLFFSFWKHIYGLLIPGCILAGLSLGLTFVDVTGGVSIMWGLSLGFLSILLVGRALFNQHNSWPAIPAVILFAVGVIVAAAQLPALFAGGLVWLPLLLIGAGLYLGWGRRNA
jgi:hypothetical protein